VRSTAREKVAKAHIVMRKGVEAHCKGRKCEGMLVKKEKDAKALAVQWKEF